MPTYSTSHGQHVACDSMGHGGVGMQGQRIEVLSNRGKILSASWACSDQHVGSGINAAH